MDAHSRSAKKKRSFKDALGNLCAYAKTHAVKHIFRIVGVAVLRYAEIRNMPSFFLEMRHNGFLQGIPRKIRSDHQVFFFYRFHPDKPDLSSKIVF